jgi:hypothetical protein
MEAVLVNLLEPGDAVFLCVNGVFGIRMAEVARRAGAEVKTIEVPWGEVIEPDLPPHGPQPRPLRGTGQKTQDRRGQHRLRRP